MKINEHEHKPIQHRDGKPPWCLGCGLTADYQKPISTINKPPKGSKVPDQVIPAEVCNHNWAWVSPRGTRYSVRLCLSCNQPDPTWINAIYEEKRVNMTHGDRKEQTKTELMADTLTVDQLLRLECLAQANTHSSRVNPPEQIIQRATLFEKYVKGEEN